MERSSDAPCGTVVSWPEIEIASARSSTLDRRGGASLPVHVVVPRRGIRALVAPKSSIDEDEGAGALLKSARGRLGLSQHSFADLLGIAQPTLSAYESGRRQPTLPTLLKLLARAGLDLRLQLAERDNHDDVIADWERSLSKNDRARLRAQRYRLVSDAA
ncbi:MAG TPA: helix-turn-helix domain-containing protein [Acidimicrobiales bacterium]|nr:helix-turn-helix domain-containing protein [Acidimicrobiales bacterium]